MLPTPEQIEGYIKQGIQCTQIKVEGDGQHFLPRLLAQNSRANVWCNDIRWSMVPWAIV